MISKARLKFLRSLGRRKVRAKEGLLLVEGVHAVAEAVDSGHAVELFLGPEARERFPDWEAESIDERDVAALSETRTPAGAFAVARDPCRELSSWEPPDPALVLLAAGVADPGNLGTLIRTAAALGSAAVAVAPGGVEPTNPKVVRATAGALFRIPVLRGDGSALAAAGFEIWIADASGTPLGEIDSRPPRCALAVGNEPRGLDDAVRSAASRSVGVPLAGGVESLNVAVAAGVILHALSGMPCRA